MARNLYTASNQWASRPADERFSSLEDLLAYCKQKRTMAKQGDIALTKLRAAVDGDDVVLSNKKGRTLGNFTNWSFSQFAQRNGTRADSVQDLPAELAAEILNYRIERMAQDGDEREASVLFAQHDDGMTVRSFTSPMYTRIWDYQVVERLMQLQATGWDVPPCYDRGNFGGELKKGNGGLYASDRDLFVFMVNESNRIDDGSDRGLARGFFCGNSEVGKTAWDIVTFLYDFICGNHIVWGAENVSRIAVRHVGDADEKTMAALKSQLHDYAEASARQIEADIRRARNFELGKSDEDVEDLVFAKRILPRKTIRASIEMARKYEDDHGSPWSAWGLAAGVTRVSQSESYSEKRVHLDRASDKILKLAVA